MEQNLDVGGRTGKEILESSWLSGELKLMEDNGVSLQELVEHWVVTRGEDTLTAAIGGVLKVRETKLERNRPIQSQEEADAEVAANLPPGGPTGKPSHISDLTNPPAAQE